MPGENSDNKDNKADLIWQDKQIGDYGLQFSKNKGEYIHGNTKDKSKEMLSMLTNPQAEVIAHLDNNPKALAKLYGISEDKVEGFLTAPEPTEARVKFKDAFEAYLKTPAGKANVEGKPSIKMRDFLGSKKLFRMYQAAVKEEVNSRSYKNAVFLKSVSHYEGETLETPVYIVAGGPSGAGKSFLKKPSVEEAVKYSPKKRKANGEIVKEGNDVVSIDNGIARNTLQVGKMVLQYSFAKGYKEISDYNEVTKASAKSKIKAACIEVGLSMYKPKTYPKPGAYKTVLKMLKKYDGYHKEKKKYDIIATNIQVNKEVVRHQGMSRAQFQGEFTESQIDLNIAEMPAESKRYGRLVANLDLLIGYWKNKSFHTGEKKSIAAAKKFRKKGIPVIEVNSQDRILVMFKEGDPDRQLVQVHNEKAGSQEAFITTRQAWIAWNLEARPGEVNSAKTDFRQFEKAFEKANPPKSTIEMDKTTQEMHKLREAYVKFHGSIEFKEVAPGQVLLPIKDFNEFLRLTEIQLKPEERKKLLLILNDRSPEALNNKVDIFQSQRFDIEAKKSLGWPKETMQLWFNKYLQEKILPLSPTIQPEAIVRPADKKITPENINVLVETSWDPLPSFNYETVSDTLGLPENNKDLLTNIKKIENQLLNAKGNLVEVDGKKVRVFKAGSGDPDFAIKTQDFYARGLQYASAMLKIQALEGDKVKHEEAHQYIAIYTQQMKDLGEASTQKSFEQAEKYTLDFMGMMSHVLSESRDDKNSDKAFEDIKKASELYSMIEPDEDAVCTVTPIAREGEDIRYEVQLSEKLTFEAPKETLQSIQSQDWYVESENKHGTWFNRFMAQNYQAVLMKSPPCTTRDAPNPSNAWKERSLWVDGNGTIQKEKEHVRVAITSPFDIKDKAERVRIAAESMKMLLSEAELEKQATAYVTRWGPLLKPGEPIEIYALHQTLISPLAIGADKKMIAVKRKSNEEVKAYLADLPPKTVNGHPVSFKLGQVNNCVNMWHPISTPTKSEKADSNHLVKQATTLLNGLIIPLSEAENSSFKTTAIFQDDLKITLAFLNRNTSKSPTEAEKKAFNTVFSDLNNQKIEGLPAETQKELALMLQAATNLKRLNHEAPATGIGSRLIQYLKKGGTITRFRDVLMSPRNNQTAKSVYELILADQLGMGMSGCKSAFDRAGEVNNHKQAMLRQFNEEGVLFDALSTDVAYREYLTTYFDPIEKAGHQNKIMAATDRVGADKKWELLTDSYLSASSEDKAKIKIASEFRKVKNPFKGKKKKEKRKDLVSRYESDELWPLGEPPPPPPPAGEPPPEQDFMPGPPPPEPPEDPPFPPPPLPKPEAPSRAAPTRAVLPAAAVAVPPPALFMSSGPSPSASIAPVVFTASPSLTPSVSDVPLPGAVSKPDPHPTLPILGEIKKILEEGGRQVGPSMGMHNAWTVSDKAYPSKNKYTISADPTNNTIQYHISDMSQHSLKILCKDVILLAKPPTSKDRFDLSQITPESNKQFLQVALETEAQTQGVAISFVGAPAPALAPRVKPH